MGSKTRLRSHEIVKGARFVAGDEVGMYTCSADQPAGGPHSEQQSLPIALLISGRFLRLLRILSRIFVETRADFENHVVRLELEQGNRLQDYD